MPHDANDILREDGPDALRGAIDGAPTVIPFSNARESRSRAPRLELGSDMEIAECVLADLSMRFGRALSFNDHMQVYTGSHWRELDDASLLEAVAHYDGAQYPTKQSFGLIKLTQSKVKSITRLLITRIEKPDFLDKPAFGIACLDGFLSLENGVAELLPHSPDQKCRACLNFNWKPLESNENIKRGLIDTLLDGAFKDDPEKAHKVDLIEELLGLALFGHTMSLPDPKAVLLYGPTAANGKSQILRMIAGFVPEAFKSNLSPAQMSDEKLVLRLDGARLNFADEIAGNAIYSERFKSVVTGEAVTGRGLYTAARSIMPAAVHVFTANDFPSFTQGMDPGVRRRLLPVGFTRTIPEHERIGKLSQLIIEHEPEALLVMAVRGALRVHKNKALTVPPSSKTLLNEWVVLNDPVEAFLSDPEFVIMDENATGKVQTKLVYGEFQRWCDLEGIPKSRQLSHAKFTQTLRRSKLVGPVTHTNGGNAVTGLILKRARS